MPKEYTDLDWIDNVLNFLDCRLMLDMELTSSSTGNLTYYIWTDGLNGCLFFICLRMYPLVNILWQTGHTILFVSLNSSLKELHASHSFSGSAPFITIALQW